MHPAHISILLILSIFGNPTFQGAVCQNDLREADFGTSMSWNSPIHRKGDLSSSKIFSPHLRTWKPGIGYFSVRLHGRLLKFFAASPVLLLHHRGVFGTHLSLGHHQHDPQRDLKKSVCHFSFSHEKLMLILQGR